MPAKMPTITRSKAVAWIKNSKGLIFACKVHPTRIKGTPRAFVARYGRIAGRITGRGLSFNPDAKNLIVIFDMHKKAWRMIAIEGLTRLMIKGVVHKVT